METIDIIVTVMAVVASLTKLIDVVTTIKGAKKFTRFMGMKATISIEKNPIGRYLFRKFGVAAGNWITFAIVVIVCAGIAWDAIVDGTLAYKVVAIVVFGVLTYGHISAGIYNTTGRQTLIVKTALKIYGWIGRIFREK